MPRFSNAKEVFAALPTQFDPAKAGDANMIVQFDLSGEGGGQWYVTLANQQLGVAEGQTANPTVTLNAAASDYVGLANGEVNAMQAFMQGKLKIKGDMSAIMKLQSLMGQ
jgi:putative sterol carrier protein